MIRRKLLVALLATAALGVAVPVKAAPTLPRRCVDAGVNPDGSRMTVCTPDW